jgi:hypothetical protein
LQTNKKIILAWYTSEDSYNQIKNEQSDMQPYQIWLEWATAAKHEHNADTFAIEPELFLTFLKITGLKNTTNVRAEFAAWRGNVPESEILKIMARE